MTEEIKARIESIQKGEVPDGYKRTRAGIMPIDWPETFAKDVFKSYTNKSHNGAYEVLSATQDRGIIPRKEVDIDIKYDEENISSYKKVDIGDFVISLRSFQGGIEYSEYEGLVSPAYTVLKATKPVDDNYYRAYFKTPDFIKRLNCAVYGIRDGKQIGFEDFGNLEIHCPPLDEQQKISNTLFSCDTVIQKYESQKASFLQLKKHLLSKMFPRSNSNIPEIRFDEFTTAWETHKFGEMFKRRMERNNGQFDKTRWISVAQMYFQEPDKVTSNNIDTRTYVMRKGDIAFEGHKNQDYKYGRFVENDIGDGVISELFPIYEHMGEYDLNYWKYAIQIEEIMAPKLLRCIEISYTSSNKLDEKFFLNEEIAVPSISEQERIGELFKEIDNLINLYTQILDELRQQKNFLSAVLLTGIVRV